MHPHFSSRLSLLFITSLALAITACGSKQKQSEEQIIVQSEPSVQLHDSLLVNTVRVNRSLDQLMVKPHTVVLTGMARHRLVTVYKNSPIRASEDSYSSRMYPESASVSSEYAEHYMPGIDLLYGYNLLSVGHYDMVAEKLNFLFDHPVLVKSLYYPSFVQDSLYKKTISRNYFLVSVYDQDTNGDTLINRHDLRRFYHFNEACSERMQLVPADYSVSSSEYDPMNDVMYVYAIHDANKNGKIDKNEPKHIFWINLRQPAPAKRLY